MELKIVLSIYTFSLDTPSVKTKKDTNFLIYQFHIDEKIKHCCKFVKVKSIKTLILQVKSFNIPSAIFSNSDSKLDVVFIKIKVVF